MDKNILGYHQFPHRKQYPNVITDGGSLQLEDVMKLVSFYWQLTFAWLIISIHVILVTHDVPEVLLNHYTS